MVPTQPISQGLWRETGGAPRWTGRRQQHSLYSLLLKASHVAGIFFLIIYLEIQWLIQLWEVSEERNCHDAWNKTQRNYFIILFLYFFSKNQSIRFFFFRERHKIFFLINKRVFPFLWKPNIFLKANFIFPTIWQEQAVQCWRSLLICADWLLKCKINLYLADVRTVALRDNDSFYSRLVTEFLRRVHKVLVPSLGKKMTTWLLTIDWIEESKK